MAGPVVSRAQNRFMRACAGQNAMDGCPPANVVDEFIEATHGMKVRELPQHVMDGVPVKGRFPNRLKTKLKPR
jgi:hypothetical protein